MKKLNPFHFLLIMTALFFTACDDPNESSSSITVAGNQDLTPTVYADETDAASSVNFATTGPWSSSIKETALKSAQLRTSTTPDWISISPDHGDVAGNYTISISLQTNTTGEDRSAVVTVLCDGTEIDITVTQKGTKEDGTVPDGNESYGGQGNFIYTHSTVSLVVDGARQAVSSYTATGSVTKSTITFYRDTINLSNAFYLDMYMIENASRLSSGSYRYSQVPISAANTFYLSGGTIGGNIYTVTGGTVDVTIQGDVYTISLDIVTEGINANGTPDGAGKLTGTYTGYLPGGKVTDNTPYIEVENPENLTQTIYADTTQGNGVTFTTSGAWTSNVRGTISTVLPDWISITPSSGSAAGKYNVTPALKVNTTGADRTAVITISCQGKTFDITVVQKGTDINGHVPQPATPTEKYGGTGNFIYTRFTASVIVDGARQSILTTSTGTGNRASLQFYKDSISLSNALYMEFCIDASMTRIPAGEYTFDMLFNTAQSTWTCYFQSGSINGNDYLPKSGKVNISLDGDTYTITFDLVTASYSGEPGKLTGTYTGYVPLE